MNILNFKRGGLLAACLFISIVSWGQTDCFPQSSIGCTPIASNLTATVGVPGYPGCEIIVFYSLRVCQGEFQVANVSVQSVPFSNPACGQFISDFLGVAFGGNQLRFERFLTLFWAGVEAQIADLIFQGALQNAQTNNTVPLLYCGTGLNTVVVTFYRGSCISFCVGNAAGSLTISQASCGTTCCARKFTYCIDPATGGTEVTEVTFQTNEGECITFALPACPGKTLFQSPCFKLCEIE